MNDDELRQFECSICLQILKKPCTVRCGHTFCYECISNSLLSVPVCPICRQPLLQSQEYLKENILLREIILRRFPRSQDSQQIQSETQQPFLEKPKKLHFPSSVVFKADTILTLGRNNIVMRIGEIPQINPELLISFLQLAQVIFINKQYDISQNQEGIEIYGIIGTLQNIHIDHKNVYFDFMGNERVIINSITINQFALNFNEQLDQQVEHKVQFTMPTCKGQVIQDVPVTLEEIQSNLSIIIPNILEFLSKVTQFNLLNQDHSSLVVQQAIQQTGILNYLNPNNLKTFDQMSKFTLKLGSILKLPAKEKQNILTTTDIIERFLLLNESIKRFQDVHNQLMIFDLQIPKHGSSFFSNFIILLGVMVAFILMYLSNAAKKMGQ